MPLPSRAVGDLFKSPEQAGTPSPLRVVVEAQTVSTQLLQWLSPRLQPDQDRLYLVRPYGRERGTQKDLPQSQRMLNVLSIEASAHG